MNFRVADIQACYELWKSRGAEFITAPIPKYGETRCYIRDPDGYIIEGRTEHRTSKYRLTLGVGKTFLRTHGRVVGQQPVTRW